jgi:hypothetical protein
MDQSPIAGPNGGAQTNAAGGGAVPASDFARLRHNPFFPYIESRLNEFLTAREQ